MHTSRYMSVGGWKSHDKYFHAMHGIPSRVAVYNVPDLWHAVLKTLHGDASDSKASLYTTVQAQQCCSREQQSRTIVTLLLGVVCKHDSSGSGAKLVSFEACTA